MNTAELVYLAMASVAILAAAQLAVWLLQYFDRRLDNKRAREWRQLNMLTNAQCALQAKRRREAEQANVRG